ncbi:MAG: hypothetical protein GXY82_01190 [Methanospirillum sp.]|nr:hypothetical protein [Methanospirillum sp.]
MSPTILLVPVEPAPTREVLEDLAARLLTAFGRTVDLREPLRPPSAAVICPDLCAAAPVAGAVAATLGCGCRDLLIGVTAASIAGNGPPAPRTCGGVLLLSAPRGASPHSLVREVGLHAGLGDCPDPGCAMHPQGEGADLCRACRGRC